MIHPGNIVKLKDKIMQRVVITKTMPLNNKTNMTHGGKGCDPLLDRTGCHHKIAVMTLEQFNKIPTEKAAELLFACCGSERWKNAMLSKFPFSDASAVIDCATSVWYNECNEADWMEAFTHHPKIGDVKSLSEKFAVTEHMAGKEQAGINEASADIIHQLKAYEQ